MPWLRVGDTTITHPIVLRALELDEADGRTLWELFGFVTACAIHAAGHKTDYIVELGTIRSLAGLSEAPRLIRQAIQCGYFTEVQGEDGRLAYKIVEDLELFHMRLKDDIEWEKRQRNDTRNRALIVPIRKRDGDACRWCGCVVYWGDQKGPRGATYDHIKPGRGAVTIEDMVVSCRSCNSSRKNDVFAWANRTPLPVPAEPRYGAKTTRYLIDNGEDVEETDTLPIKVEGRPEKFTPVTPAPVDPAPVETVAVEPERLAPGTRTPGATAPGPVETVAVEPERLASATPSRAVDIEEQRRRFEQDIQEYEAWHPAASTDPTSTEKKADLSHSELLAISRATDLDVPGRDGSGNRNTNHKRTQETPEPDPSVPKPKRRRRRRRKKSNGE